MAYVTHPNFRRWRYPRPRRRNVLRRTVSRFQLVDLFVVIGAILLLWGSLSVGGVSSALRAPPAWLEFGPNRNYRRRHDPQRDPGLSPRRLQHPGIGGGREMSARTRRGGSGPKTPSRAGCRRRARPQARSLRLCRRHGRNRTMQLRPALRHTQSPRTGCGGNLDRRGLGRALCLRNGVLPVARDLVLLIRARASPLAKRFEAAPAGEARVDDAAGGTGTQRNPGREEPDRGWHLPER